jgi:CBS domain containing-hemolysin-like protein
VIWALVAALVLLVANAAFVAVEFALLGARRSRLEPLAEGGSRRAAVALASMDKLNTQLAGAQLGITLASLTLGYVAEPLVVHLFEDLFGVVGVPEVVSAVVAFVIGLGIVVFVHMVVGEMVPKNIAITHPDATLLALALPNRWYLIVATPLVWLLNTLANALVRLGGITPRQNLNEVPDAEDLVVMLAESQREGFIERGAHRLLTGVLEFRERTVASVMVPVEEVVSVTPSTRVADAERIVADCGHSRLPVLADHDSGDPGLLGFVHAKDLLGLSGAAGGRPLPMRLVRRMPVVSPDRALDELMRAMRHTGVHIAAVAGTDGELIGLVTLEDLLEELVGEIEDETDPDPG